MLLMFQEQFEFFSALFAWRWLRSDVVCYATWIEMIREYNDDEKNLR